MDKKELTAEVKRLALEAGFDKVGIAPASLDAKREEDLTDWLRSGFAAGMDYMTRDGLKRARPVQVLPGARSVISLALNYFYPQEERQSAGLWGRIARYARGRDYHRVIEKKLKTFTASLHQIAPGASVKTYVDTGPIMEKAFAQAAGIGFYGKNTNILTVDRGSWLFLASAITDMDLERDAPHLGTCGSCRLCLDACPTSALVEPYKLDASKCISYWTIEAKGDIPQSIADGMGDWVFGCDICQEVCPYNRKAKPSGERDFDPMTGAGAWLNLDEVSAIASDEDFIERFKGTPLKRPKRSGLARNAKVVRRNLTADCQETKRCS